MLSDSGRTNVYTASNLRTRGTITYGASNTSYIDNRTDEVWILEFGKSACKVSYPVGKKRAEAYVPTSAITSNNGTHRVKNATGKFLCSLRANSGLSNSYYVDKGDSVELFATSGSELPPLIEVAAS